MTTTDGPFVRTGFADEIAPDLESQLDTLDELGYDHLDLRKVDDTNLVEWDDEKVRRVKATLDDRGFGVSSLGSPIGKSPSLTRSSLISLISNGSLNSRPSSRPSTFGSSRTTFRRATTPSTTARRCSAGPARRLTWPRTRA